MRACRFVNLTHLIDCLLACLLASPLAHLFFHLKFVQTSRHSLFDVIIQLIKLIEIWNIRLIDWLIIHIQRTTAQLVNLILATWHWTTQWWFNRFFFNDIFVCFCFVSFLWNWMPLTNMSICQTFRRSFHWWKKIDLYYEMNEWEAQLGMDQQ